MKKYELTEETKIIGDKMLFRIRALRSFGDIKAGDLGGFIENERNLSHEDNAWVSGNAKVIDNARVSDNALVIDNARVSGYAKVGGKAIVGGEAWVSGEAQVSDDGLINSNNDYLCEKGLGSHNRSASFFKCKDGHIHVLCGCFSGNLDEFENKVKEEHGNSKYAKEYLGFIEVVKTHFEVRQ